MDEPSGGSSVKTTKEIIHDNIFTYFNLIFAILGLLLILVGAFRGSDIFAGDHFEYIDRYRPGGPGKECTGQDDDAACVRRRTVVRNGPEEGDCGGGSGDR